MRVIRALRSVIQPESPFIQQVAVIGLQHRAVLHLQAALAVRLEVPQRIDRSGKVAFRSDFQTDFHRLTVCYPVRYRHGFHRKRVFLPDIQPAVTRDKVKKGGSQATGRHHTIKDFSFHRYISVSGLENVFDANSILAVATARGAAPHKPLAQPEQQDNTVRQVAFRFQCRRTAVNERFTPVQGGTVIQQFLASVYRLIPQQGRDTEVQEQHLARRGKERMVIAALARVLRRRNMRVPVWDVAPERLPAEHPLVSFFRVGGNGQREGVTGIVPVRSAVKSVRHFRRETDTLHSRQTALRMGLPRHKGKQRKGDIHIPFHRTFSSLIVSARTRSSFSISKDWWRPPCFSYISTTSFLSSGG